MDCVENVQETEIADEKWGDVTYSLVVKKTDKRIYAATQLVHAPVPSLPSEFLIELGILTATRDTGHVEWGPQRRVTPCIEARTPIHVFPRSHGGRCFNRRVSIVSWPL